MMESMERWEIKIFVLIMCMTIDAMAIARRLHQLRGATSVLQSGSAAGSGYGFRPTFRGPPAQGCRMCQDVAHTFRAQFPCPGNKDDSMSFYVRRFNHTSSKNSPDFDVIPTANTCGHVGRLVGGLGSVATH